MRKQAEKARVFRSLHERAGAFIIPNPSGYRHGADSGAFRI